MRIAANKNLILNSFSYIAALLIRKKPQSFKAGGKTTAKNTDKLLLDST